jgi:ribosomal protein S3
LEARDQSGSPIASSVELRATADGIRVDVTTARPGTVIGPRGSNVEKLPSDLAELIDGYVTVNVVPAADKEPT